MTWVHSVAVVCSLVWLSAAPAHAQKPKPTYEDGKILVKSSDPLAGACWSKQDGTTYALTEATEACLDLLELDVPKDVKVSEDGLFTIDGKETPVSCVFSGRACLASPAGVATAQGPFVLVLTKDSALKRYDAKAGASRTGAAEAGGVEFEECDWGVVGDGDVRIDFTRPSVVQAPPRNVVHPNQGLVVHVCLDPSSPVTVLWGGARGMTRATMKQPEATIDGDQRAETDTPQEKPKVKPRISRFTFPPRTAGAADLKLFKGTDTSGEPGMEVQLEVEPLYWGAVRFGLGTLFGPWRGYEVATLSGSRQQEVRESKPRATFELVSGFAPYVIDAWSGGRSHSGGQNMRVAPFFGFGVIGSSDGKQIEALSSVHLGLEYEVASNFSIAATFVYRRTRALADGYEPRSPVEMGMDAEDVTISDWRPGFGVVVNATPAFLEFATGKSSSAGGGQ